jgi:hypothetical protein
MPNAYAQRCLHNSQTRGSVIDQTTIKDAKMLLLYACSHGLLSSIDPTPILQIEDHLALGRADIQAETAFLTSFAAVASAVKPVDVTSLRATLGTDSDPPKCLRAVRNFTCVAVAAFLALAIVQIYWVIGNSVVQDLSKASIERDQRWDDMTTANDNETAASDKLKENPKDSEAKKQIQEAKKQIQDLNMRIVELNKRFDSDVRLLGSWNNVWKDLLTPWNHWHFGEGDTATLAPRLLQTAQFSLDGIRQFVLPLLYGLLGASIYVLRSLSREIQSVTFRDAVDYRLRLPLGALAGVAVAWIIPSPTSPVAPQVVGFLAGYSVEVLFTAMDGIVSSLAGRTGPNKDLTPR